MTAKQQTIAQPAELEGAGIHTGETARVRFAAADTGTGIRFRRTDMKDAADIPADLDHVFSTDRGTSLAQGDARVHTIEHLLAAVVAHGIDNIIIEVDGPEIPIADGSFKPFFDAIAGAGTIEQPATARTLTFPGSVTAEGPAGVEG